MTSEPSSFYFPIFAISKLSMRPAERKHLRKRFAALKIASMLCTCTYECQKTSSFFAGSVCCYLGFMIVVLLLAEITSKILQQCVQFSYALLVPVNVRDGNCNCRQTHLGEMERKKRSSQETDRVFENSCVFICKRLCLSLGRETERDIFAESNDDICLSDRSHCST